jgi:PAS domain S-box-containing protein
MVGGDVECGGGDAKLQAEIEKLREKLDELSGVEERCRLLEKEREEAQRLLQQMVGTTEDALENLGDSSGPLRGIISALHDTLIVGIDRSGRYLFNWIDPALEEKYGIRAGDLKGRSIMDMFPPDEAAERLSKTRRVFETGERYHEEYRLGLPTGEVWHEATVAPMQDSSGAVNAVVGIVHDVTARKRAEEERNRLREKLHRAVKLESLGILAGGIAHDFGSLMMGTLGNTRRILKVLPADSPARPTLAGIESAVKQAYDLVQGLLAFAGERNFDLRRCDLAEIAKRSIEMVRSSALASVGFELEVSPDLPAAEVDETQFIQVLTNLLRNASDAIGQHGGTVRVRIGTVRADREFLASTYLNEDLAPGEYLSLEVQDDGCGMTEPQLDRVFDPFFSTKANGRGLGLSPLPGILRGHSADVRIESRVGAGTTFQLILPISRPGGSK